VDKRVPQRFNLAVSRVVGVYGDDPLVRLNQDREAVESGLTSLGAVLVKPSLLGGRTDRIVGRANLVCEAVLHCLDTQEDSCCRHLLTVQLDFVTALVYHRVDERVGEGLLDGPLLDRVFTAFVGPTWPPDRGCLLWCTCRQSHTPGYRRRENVDLVCR
jgi:hypothetical protein